MLEELLLKYGMYRTKKIDILNIKNKLKSNKYKILSDTQKKAINNYYKCTLGKTVPLYWHEYFTYRNGLFSVKYIPTSIYHSDIIYKLNNYKLRHAYVDKALYDIYFNDINRPKTIIKNINGYFYDNEKSISINDAIERCNNLEIAVIKPTMDGMWGQGISMISTKTGLLSDGMILNDLFKKYKKNFIIQEKVIQSDEMAKLNPTSLNTLRVLSYRDNNDIFILYVVVRIGRQDKTVDNETAGGINADIDLSTGKIIECAYGTPMEGKIYRTDVGTSLKDFEVPSFEKLLVLVKELHLRLPYFNLVGWDFGIDNNNGPVLIEWNRNPDLSQTAHGPAFGEMTDEILKRTKILPDSRFVGFDK